MKQNVPLPLACVAQNLLQSISNNINAKHVDMFYDQNVSDGACFFTCDILKCH